MNTEETMPFQPQPQQPQPEQAPPQPSQPFAPGNTPRARPPMKQPGKFAAGPPPTRVLAGAVAV